MTLLCQPLGGLNDVFCQINACLKFAERTKRDIFIETEFNKFFQEPFNRAFSIESKVPVHFAGKSNIDSLPPEIQEVIAQQTMEYETDRERADFSKRSNQPHIRHRASGGGLNSLKLLPRLALTDWSEEVVKFTQRELGFADFDVLNVRNAGLYLSDITRVREDIPKRLERLGPSARLLVVSDDSEMPEKLRLQEHPSFFDHRPIYRKIGNIERESKLIQPLVDLALLTNANGLKTYPFEGFRYQYSGFSRLGKALWLARAMNAGPSSWSALLNSEGVSDFGSRFLDEIGKLYFLAVIFSIRKSTILKQLTFDRPGEQSSHSL